MGGLIEWESPAMFKRFCLDRIAAGLSIEVIANEASTFLNRVVSNEDVLSVVEDSEVEVRKAELMDEVRVTAPLITRDALSVLRDIKNLTHIAKEKFDSEDMAIRDFKTYISVLDLNLKALETISKQLDKLSDNESGRSEIIVKFSFADLERLANAGVIDIKKKDKALEWLGEGDVIDVEADES